MAEPISRRRVIAAGAMLGLLPGARQTAAASQDDDLPASGAAYAPWRDWRIDRADGPAGLVRSAILAANAHDTQPWRFCVSPGRIDILADQARNLGAMDPFRREMQLSLGCALENLLLAAGACGYGAQVAVAPGRLQGAAAGLRPVARVTLAAAAAVSSPLAVAIRRRHTNRGRYDPARSLGQDVLEQLRRAGAADDRVRLILLTDPATRADFAAATLAATQAIIADRTMIADSDTWFRGTNAEIDAHRDGPTLYAAGLSPLTLLLARAFPVSPARAHRAWLDHTRDVQLATAAAFGLIAVRDLYDAETAFSAGRIWQRLHLTAVTLGVAMQPLNQLPERVDREQQLGLPATAAGAMAALTGDAAWHPTFAFRAGWPLRAAPASPRRDLRAVLLPEGCARDLPA